MSRALALSVLGLQRSLTSFVISCQLLHSRAVGLLPSRPVWEEEEVHTQGQCLAHGDGRSDRVRCLSDRRRRGGERPGKGGPMSPAAITTPGLAPSYSASGLDLWAGPLPETLGVCSENTAFSRPSGFPGLRCPFVG